eukprot:TRINITY_DN14086_c0_g1_i1.p2 TRINITY_DN14086_c0_g1~~TRINITY_DN14086_c0_g1_i1.p2  ORF type:complete len:194 (+),score=54.78 TRINITY_DN14086_c0_g1_i1:518-1099(+)
MLARAAFSRVGAVLPRPAVRRFAAVSVGTDLNTEDISLQAARSWDAGVADGFKKTTLKELFGGSKVALFAVPGAYTGVCSQGHVPSFVKVADSLKAKGVDKIVCVSVNDPYTMAAWQKEVDAKGVLEFYGDSDASFSQHLGKALDLNVAMLGPGMRSHRYSMLVENGKVTKLFEEEAPSDLKKSDGETMLNDL